MRVLHIYSGNLNGGIEALLKTLAAQRSLCPAMEPHFALCFEGRIAADLRSAGAPVFLAGPVRVSRPWTVVAARKRLADFLRSHAFDVAVCHGSWPHLLFAPVARDSGLPLAHWRHDVTNGRHWTDRWAMRVEPDLVVCNSRFTAASFEWAYGGAPRTVMYYPVAAPAAWTPEELLVVRRELDTPPETVAIAHASRLEEWKGHRTLLHALSLLPKQLDWVCWMAGAPQRPSEIRYRDALRADVRRYGIAGRVRFPGWVDDVPRFFAAAQIHCQPNSAPEPFGIAFIEAMAAGLPVVTTALGAPCEFVSAAEGVLVAPGDTAELAIALERMISDVDLRARLGAAGRLRSRQLCDPQRQFESLAAALGSIAGKGIAWAGGGTS